MKYNNNFIYLFIPLKRNSSSGQTGRWILTLDGSNETDCLFEVSLIANHLGGKIPIFGLPLSSDRQHLSCDVCLEVRGEIIRTVLCGIVY